MGAWKFEAIEMKESRGGFGHGRLPRETRYKVTMTSKDGRKKVLGHVYTSGAYEPMKQERRIQTPEERSIADSAIIELSKMVIAAQIMES